MRTKPENADWHAWDSFECWADREGVGEITEDWENWWECWKAGYNAAMNEA